MWTVHDLRADDASQVLAHFGGLGHDALVQRFGTFRPPHALSDYVAGMRWAEQEVLGVAQHGHLVGVAHLARTQNGQAELGLSVLPSAQRQGVGSSLFHACWQRAQVWGLPSIVLHHQHSNLAIVRLARAVAGPAAIRRHATMLMVTIPRLSSLADLESTP